MKKRLSLLLAALMIITLLPMSAFAAASVVNTTLDITASAEDKTDEYKNVSVTFKVPKGSTINAGKLRLELDNGAEFRPTDKAQLVDNKNVVIADITDGTNTASVANADVTNPVGNIIFVDVKAAPASVVNSNAEGTLTLNVPVYFPNTGDVMLKLVDESNVGFGSLAPVKIAVVKDYVAGLTMTSKDAEKTISFDGGELSQFEIKNLAPAPNGATHLVITLSDDEYSFDTTATGTKMFVDGSEKADVATKLDGLVLAVTDVSAAKSVLVIPKLKGMGRNATEGTVRAYAQYAKIEDANGANEKVSYLGNSASATIGKVVDYNVTMTIVEKGKKEMPSVWGGEKVMVTVTLKGPKGSILPRAIDFSADGMDVTYSTASATVKPSGGGAVTLDGKDDKGTFKDAQFSLKPDSNTALQDKVEVKFDIELQTDGSKDGVATLTAAQRGWEVKADAVKVTPKFKTTAELNPIKKGEAREVSEVKITEAKAGLLEKGERLVLTFNTRRDYTQFTSRSIKVEATNGMKLDTDAADIKWVDGADGRQKVGLAIPVLKSSTGEPSVITISGLKVSVDGSATDDVIKLTTGLVKRGDDPKLANLITVSTAEYVKVVKEYALESILTVFTIGQTQYTVNGEAKTAASAPYIKNGKTMLPIRALSESLGLTVQWNGATKTATFTDSTKVAAVTIGAERMYVNGTPIPLGAKAELVNGTTFVELRSLATAFGVQIDWDAAAKTATVSK
ncbi:MAG: copper amine oxidase N-terminal domain-containing protein [Peptostreptococcaceae bacterium]|nr:copper amine oxidase N-terminal domain-containing protein [Peptostreptococcaceae bacterium]